MDEFLRELAELTKKHGIKIGGCGDCGSPWLRAVGINNAMTDVEELRYHDNRECSDNGTYTVGEIHCMSCGI